MDGPGRVGAASRAAVRDGRFLAWAFAWALAALLAFGLVSAIIPNPVFGRQIPPEAFAVGVWLVSAPLMGLLAATYTVGPRSPRDAAPIPLTIAALDARDPAAREQRSSVAGTIGSIGTFLAIGCPVCNKVALLLLGTGGALTVFAPLQPVIGAASVALLAGTLAWRLPQWARGECRAAVP
jgi:hypothetical protein